MVKQLALGALALTTSMTFAEGLRVGGHVDAGYNWVKGSTNTFSVNEGHIELEKSLGAGKGMLDMPLTVPTAVSNRFALSGADGQAFVAWKYSNGFNWKLGKFDSMYAMDAKYSNGNHLLGHSLLYSAVPHTHTGLDLGYDLSDMLGVQLLVANHQDTGVMTLGNPDFGVKLDAKMDMFKLGVGALFGRKSMAGAKTDMLFDVTAAAGLGMLDLNLQFLMSKPNIGNTGMGFGVVAAAHIDENLGAAAGFDFSKDLTSAGNTMQFRIGPHYQWTKDLVTKLDYEMVKPNTGSATNGVSLAGIYTF